MVDQQVLNTGTTTSSNSWSSLAAWGVALAAAVVALSVYYYWNSVVAAGAGGPPLSEEELRKRRFERLQQHAATAAAAATAASNGSNTTTKVKNDKEKTKTAGTLTAASKSTTSATTKKNGGTRSKPAQQGPKKKDPPLTEEEIRRRRFECLEQQATAVAAAKSNTKTNQEASTNDKHVLEDPCSAGTAKAVPTSKPEQDPTGNKDPTSLGGAPSIGTKDEAASVEPQLLDEPKESPRVALASAQSPSCLQQQITDKKTKNLIPSPPDLPEKEETSLPSSAVESQSPVISQNHNQEKQQEEESSAAYTEEKDPATTSVTDSQTSSPTKKKTPRRHKRKPPTVLHRALCQITGASIAQADILDAGDCWDSLRDSFMPAFLNTSRHFSGVSMRSAVHWHNRLRDAIRDCDDQDKRPLSECLNLLGAHLVQHVATAVVESSGSTEAATSDFDLGDDEDDDDGLFSAEYSNNDAVAAQMVVPNTKSKSNALVEFLVLLEPVETLVSKQFLEAVIAVQPSSLPGILLWAALRRIPSIDPCQKGLTRDEILKSLTCLSNLVIFSSAVAQELWSVLEKEIGGGHDDHSEVTGRTMEEASALGKLLPLAALAIPNAGQETAPRGASTPTPSSRSLSYAQRILRDVDNYPIVAFEPRTSSNSKKLDLALSDLQRTMTLARDACTTILKRVMKAGAQSNKKETRQSLFRWLGVVVKLNEGNVHVLATDLLRADGPQQLFASRKFLLGAASVIVNFCADSLAKRFEQMGATAFDALYLTRGVDELGGESERCLVTVPGGLPSASGAFTGSTEFFFQTAHLLRVSLFPCFRAQQQLHHKDASIYNRLRELADSEQHNSERPVECGEQAKRSVDAFLGWDLILRDQAFVKTVTTFSLTQLKWLVSLGAAGPLPAGKSGTTRTVYSIVPEWFCKLPAEWIAFVATSSSRFLTLHEAEVAVECATRLLHFGTEIDGQHFSPPVITELIRIPGAFVRAGISRARAKTKGTMLRRLPSKQRQKAAEEVAIDDRELDIYTSFDRNDLGVTAFTNKYVLQNLGSTLISTFSVLDAVEGADVEREHNFDKFLVKGEVIELLLRLWSHPSGDAKQAILASGMAEISRFVSSLGAAICLMLDDDCHKLVDLRDIVKGMLARGRMTPRESHIYDFLAKSVMSGISSSRLFLLFLCYLSVDDEVAALLGGARANENADFRAASRNVANLLVTFLDRLTNDDGGTNVELIFPDIKPLDSRESRTLDSSQEEIEKILRARRFVAEEFGFDASILAHTFLAVGARWHSAAAAAGGAGGGNTSYLAELVAKHDDCNMDQLRLVLKRLIVATSKGDDPVECDGHVDFSLWEDKFDIKTETLSKNIPNRRTITVQNQIKHSFLETLASSDDISCFLDAIAAEQERSKCEAASIANIDSEALPKLEKALLDCTCMAGSDDYTYLMSEWTISSDSFALKSGKLDHFYEPVARKAGSLLGGSGKILVKEAKKCKRMLPQPLQDAAIFVCFEEERMDVCRAVITGTDETPYALGLFVFDIFFPSMFPSAPPLVTFMTTGGGQVRFNPNLYNDGKVCISLLGTARAWNTSQQWNESSSLAQVLMSIQTQILGVPDPYFNEGFGHEGMRNTVAGNEGSTRYNHTLRLATLRHAVIAHLKLPPRGFEEITKRHFSLCRKRLLVQARRWMVEAKGLPIYGRFVRAYNELVVLLSSDHFKAFRAYDKVLPPSKADMKQLRAIDHSFADKVVVGDEEDKKPRAQLPQLAEDTTLAVEDFLAAANPWANIAGEPPSSQADGNNSARTTGESDDPDDELYL